MTPPPGPPSRFFFLDFTLRLDWWTSVLDRAKRSLSPTIRQRLEGWAHSPGYEWSLAVGTRLRVLPILVRRLDADLAVLGRQLADRPDRVERASREHTALPLPQDHVGFDLVADLDAFLFEMRSLYELTGRLLAAFSTCILGRQQTERTLVEVLERAGQDVGWIETLRDDRVRFFHEGAPWWALEVTGGDPPYELLILRRNTHDLADSNDWRRLSDYRSILDGYLKAVKTLAEWAQEEIEDVERQEGVRS